MSQSNLYLIRHGQTDWNEKKRIQGITEVPLNEIGREQVRKVARNFSDLLIGAIYTSPLQRAKETAEIMGSFHPCAIVEERMLHEGKFGALEGITIPEFDEKYAEEIKRRHQLPCQERIHHKYTPDGESIYEILSRVIPFLHRIARDHMGENVIVVTHGFVMKSLFIDMSRIIGEFDERKIFVSNAGVLHLVGDGLSLQVVRHEGIELK
jgi:broad specificity phosphatase PhoE